MSEPTEPPKTKYPSSFTGGVEALTIARRMVRERERCIGMTDEERLWRKKWIQDQILAPNEPVHVPELKDSLTNPIRKFYQRPLNVIFDKLVPVLGQQRAQTWRYLTGKYLMTIAGAYFLVYYFKYNQNDWTRKGGWYVSQSQRSVLPGDPGYPKVSDRNKPSDYANRGFDTSPI